MGRGGRRGDPCDGRGGGGGTAIIIAAAADGGSGGEAATARVCRQQVQRRADAIVMNENESLPRFFQEKIVSLNVKRRRSG